MTIKNNFLLCKQTNRIKLNISYFAHAIVGTEWNGTITPSASILYYILDADAYITVNGEKMTLFPGKWYILPSECTFDYRCDSRMDQYYFHLKLCDYDEIDLLSAIPKPIEFTFEEMTEELLEYYLDSDKLLDGLRLQQKILNKLLDVTQKNNIHLSHGDYSPCVYKALTYIKNNLKMNLSLSVIAENAFVSESTLSKHFKKELGISVNKYISDMVMFEAEKMLCSSSMPIKSISDKLGFSDPFYFSRKFRQNHGISPREYMNKMSYKG